MWSNFSPNTYLIQKEASSEINLSLFFCIFSFIKIKFGIIVLVLQHQMYDNFFDINPFM